jgi:hypothetical protein
MRLLLGQHRSTGPRAALSAAAIVHSERLAGRAIGAALDPESDPLKAGSLALSIIREAEPRSSATLEVTGEIDPDAIEKLSFRELMSLAASHGITPAETPPQLPA